MTKPTIKTIALFPKIQADTAVSVFLLKRFGTALFPGIDKATFVFWTEIPKDQSEEEWQKEGTFLLDLGGGTFDHHPVKKGEKSKEPVSAIIARHLGITEDPSLKKMLAWAKRDDLEGKGTLSEDPLDRAFGLSGIISVLGRVYNEEPAKALDIVLPIFEAHYEEEEMRTKRLPEEWKELQNNPATKRFTVMTANGPLKCIAMETPNIRMVGFLRAYLGLDVLIQRFPSGHTNIITNQKQRPNLGPVIARLRLEEARQIGLGLDPNDIEQLTRPGRLEGIEEWFFDTAANTIQNGGISPQGTNPTRLTLETIQRIVQEELT
ncbi:MAG: hypothetical protein Q7S89_02730 [bacterium]|nr:hypothetical protein [bacterium]